MTQTPAIELRDVTVVYNENSPNEVFALKNVSLCVSPGETVVLLGGNGSGKSTLLKAVAGTAPVKSGTVLLGGRDVTRWPAYRRSRHIGYVHQDPMLGTCPSLTVHENFQLSANVRWWLPTPFPLKLRGEDRVSLQRTGLPLEERASTPVTMLSGGQRQAIALCLAFASPQSVLLLDEFTAALDTRTMQTVSRYVRQEIERTATTVLFVTHDLDHAAESSATCCLMVDGELRETFADGDLQASDYYRVRNWPQKQEHPEE